MTRRHLVIMAKAPVMGRVKSRLAADIGPVAATAFYRRELVRLCRVFGCDRRWRTVLAVTPDHSIDDALWPDFLDRVAQGGGDLGQRMARIMGAMPPGPVVIVGSDIPGLGARQIEAAFAMLGSRDAVFGPATDGGYYLVGLKRMPRVPNAFLRVRWSGPHALADTLANLNRLEVGFLQTLADIDTGEDWFRWRAGAACGRRGIRL